MADTSTYNPQGYNGLASLHEAFDRFNSRSAQAALDKEIRNVFAKHDRGADFGITLLHRHFPLNHDQILVEHGSVSTPWPKYTMAGLMGGSVTPKSWLFKSPDSEEGSLSPYEFGFVQDGDSHELPNLKNYEGFANDLYAVLEENGLIDILGVAALPAGGKRVQQMEKTFGMANVVFDVEKAALFGDDEKDTITALWYFPRDGESGMEVMRCTGLCRCG